MTLVKEKTFRREVLASFRVDCLQNFAMAATADLSIISKWEQEIMKGEKRARISTGDSFEPLSDSSLLSGQTANRTKEKHG
jgi:hypothetical protein